VVQIVRVYESLVNRHPCIESLAKAPLHELRSLLHPLGLHWRVDLMQEMAVRIVREFGGNIPIDRKLLISLPGVSDYIASCLRCFAWNVPDPVIDTNTVRVVGRLFNLNTKDSTRRNQHFRKLASTLVDPTEPRVYNYALLDLASQVCMKRYPPKCRECPVFSICLFETKC
jgi:A/G-specific adenine glycosylase